MEASGSNEQSDESKAKEFYLAEMGTSFSLEHCYNILSKHPNNTDEDEVSSQRPVGRKCAKGLEADTRDYTTHMEQLYCSHSDYIRKDDERNTILREGLEFAHINMESDNRHTMAMEREQAMK
ncbi:hypothetical protein PHYBLDRAFT_141125 [Phycomyces blakesleeanus NRRL 1555(-)]|uniref:Uncharacterized protein n=1 Tax=Phycomyces blakesleeanus (strain ATCC 8743b / DSM 1359 / FGSC 10004 / NBRC 33097 / NRRL 1555) TaxID=763407 RepID=A0A163B9T0_PHYB8|nr:hypothetical protein PHYBLDRAFT_141125 [Phycomyces blakesleeanus NRRL 1555(-)]OAD79071.1 hypothetical protein PHYBLDRAFT_141125 [Phycomyces blakesleeanus NRRL 1555(-)]|eukprot:XP_018297111.1 hypothetical protein PHYBLDRAFT_141125 [Phycomyces blakesleeanus NRRL 1555(-)]